MRNDVSSCGLSKDAIRRIALAKLAIVYRDWGFHDSPFADFASAPGERREDARAFIMALIAALLGGITDAIDENNRAIEAGLESRQHRRSQRSGRDAKPLRSRPAPSARPPR